MNGNTSATPSTLNAMWATATRLASALAPMAAMSAVAHVPTLAPSTMATAPWRLSSPCWARTRARPIVAADDVNALKAAATMTASSVLSVSTLRSWLASGVLVSGLLPSRITFKPRNMRPRPRTPWPTPLRKPQPATSSVGRPRSRSVSSAGFARAALRGKMGRIVQGHERGRLDHRQRAVVDAQAPERVERAAEDMAGVDADDAAVGDDEHVIAVRMGGADPVDGLEHPPAHVGQRLGSGRRAVERRSAPRPVRR